MIRHEPVLPPEDIFPIHDWRVVESRLNLKKIPQTETIFSTANGYLGMRGAFEEGGPAGQHGTFINGFYESWPIPYGERAFGFATHGQTIVDVPDGKIIRLYIDDEPFDLESAFIQRYERVLDMQNGTLDRESGAIQFATANGEGDSLQDGTHAGDVLPQLALLVISKGGKVVTVRSDDLDGTVWSGPAMAELRFALA